MSLILCWNRHYLEPAPNNKQSKDLLPWIRPWPHTVLRYKRNIRQSSAIGIYTASLSQIYIVEDQMWWSKINLWVKPDNRKRYCQYSSSHAYATAITRFKTYCRLAVIRTTWFFVFLTIFPAGYYIAITWITKLTFQLAEKHTLEPTKWTTR